MKRSGTIFLFILMIFLCNVPGYLFADKIPQIINTDEDAGKVLDKAKKILNEKLGMKFKYPVEMKLVTGKELDEIMANSPYKGAIVGIFRFAGGKHNIYMMKNTGKDDFYGTVCHEMTHAWQAENCPGQTIVLKEGLAVWVEYKALMWDGAYAKARSLNRNTADPIYGTGYRFIQTIEDKYGENNVLEQVKKLKDIPPGSK